jgi:hypothetical protein
MPSIPDSTLAEEKDHITEALPLSETLFEKYEKTGRNPASADYSINTELDKDEREAYNQSVKPVGNLFTPQFPIKPFRVQVLLEEDKKTQRDPFLEVNDLKNRHWQWIPVETPNGIVNTKVLLSGLNPESENLLIRDLYRLNQIVNLLPQETVGYYISNPSLYLELLSELNLLEDERFAKIRNISVNRIITSNDSISNLAKKYPYLAYRKDLAQLLLIEDQEKKKIERKKFGPLNYKERITAIGLNKDQQNQLSIEFAEIEKAQYSLRTLKASKSSLVIKARYNDPTQTVEQYKKERKKQEDKITKAEKQISLAYRDKTNIYANLLEENADLDILHEQSEKFVTKKVIHRLERFVEMFLEDPSLHNGLDKVYLEWLKSRPFSNHRNTKSQGYTISHQDLINLMNNPALSWIKYDQYTSDRFNLPQEIFTNEEAGDLIIKSGINALLKIGLKTNEDNLEFLVSQPLKGKPNNKSNIARRSFAEMLSINYKTKENLKAEAIKKMEDERFKPLNDLFTEKVKNPDRWATQERRIHKYIPLKTKNHFVYSNSAIDRIAKKYIPRAVLALSLLAGGAPYAPKVVNQVASSINSVLEPNNISEEANPNINAFAGVAEEENKKEYNPQNRFTSKLVFGVESIGENKDTEKESQGYIINPIEFHKMPEGENSVLFPLAIESNSNISNEEILLSNPIVYDTDGANNLSNSLVYSIKTPSRYAITPEGEDYYIIQPPIGYSIVSMHTDNIETNAFKNLFGEEIYVQGDLKNILIVAIPNTSGGLSLAKSPYIELVDKQGSEPGYELNPPSLELAEKTIMNTLSMLESSLVNQYEHSLKQILNEQENSSNPAVYQEVLLENLISKFDVYMQQETRYSTSPEELTPPKANEFKSQHPNAQYPFLDLLASVTPEERNFACEFSSELFKEYITSLGFKAQIITVDVAIASPKENSPNARQGYVNNLHTVVKIVGPTGKIYYYDPTPNTKLEPEEEKQNEDELIFAGELAETAKELAEEQNENSGKAENLDMLIYLGIIYALRKSKNIKSATEKAKSILSKIKSQTSITKADKNTNTSNVATEQIQTQTINNISAEKPDQQQPQQSKINSIPRQSSVSINPIYQTPNQLRNEGLQQESLIELSPELKDTVVKVGVALITEQNPVVLNYLTELNARDIPFLKWAEEHSFTNPGQELDLVKDLLDQIIDRWHQNAILFGDAGVRDSLSDETGEWIKTLIEKHSQFVYKTSLEEQTVKVREAQELVFNLMDENERKKFETILNQAPRDFKKILLLVLELNKARMNVIYKDLNTTFLNEDTSVQVRENLLSKAERANRLVKTEIRNIGMGRKYSRNYIPMLKMLEDFTDAMAKVE